MNDLLTSDQQVPSRGRGSVSLQVLIELSSQSRGRQGRKLVVMKEVSSYELARSLLFKWSCLASSSCLALPHNVLRRCLPICALAVISSYLAPGVQAVSGEESKLKYGSYRVCISRLSLKSEVSNKWFAEDLSYPISLFYISV